LSDKTPTAGSLLTGDGSLTDNAPLETFVIVEELVTLVEFPKVAEVVSFQVCAVVLDEGGSSTVVELGGIELWAAEAAPSVEQDIEIFQLVLIIEEPEYVLFQIGALLVRNNDDDISWELWLVKMDLVATLLSDTEEFQVVEFRHDDALLLVEIPIEGAWMEIVVETIEVVAKAVPVAQYVEAAAEIIVEVWEFVAWAWQQQALVTSKTK
jgi:hypothetical protein